MPGRGSLHRVDEDTAWRVLVELQAYRVRDAGQLLLLTDDVRRLLDYLVDVLIEALIEKFAPPS